MGLIRIGKNLALVQAALDVVALGLLRKDHRHAVALGADRGQRDTARLGGQHHRDVLHVEILGELIRQLAHQGGVDAVVQEPVDLDDVSGENPALRADALLELFHCFSTPLIFCIHNYNRYGNV